MMVRILRRKEEEQESEYPDAVDLGMTQNDLLKAYFTEQMLQCVEAVLKERHV